jgi:membrane-associated phospholipid phosphatase
MNMIEKRIAAGETITAHPHRVLAYMAMAMYDATIVTWNAKYTYKRSRPSDFDPRLNPVVAVPDSPSYPSEHAAVAAAAAGVLAYLFPDQANFYQKLAAEAAASRVAAGVQYPSDASAGLELGRQVAQNVIQRMANDGYTLAWAGSVPTGRCLWTGSNPGGVTAPNWKPILLSSPGEFRPAPPPDCASDEMKAEVALVKNFTRTFNTNQKAYYWQSAEGRETWPYILAERWMFEDTTDRNPPRAARAYALLAAAEYDAYIASQDGKFTYWYLRPNQLDPGITPLFAVPNFPSYPSNHAVFSYTRAEVLAYLFPAGADEARGVGKEASDSRIWAGIHYPVDVQAGMRIGQAVAHKFIEWAQQDGSQ